MSAATIDKPKKAKAVNPDSLPCPIDFGQFQAWVEAVAMSVELPPIQVGREVKTPLEEYTDANGVTRKRARKAMQFDEEGNPVHGSGPFASDDFILDLWNKIKPWAEREILKTAFRMSESILLHPERNGKIDERSQLMQPIPGRFVLADDQ